MQAAFHTNDGSFVNNEFIDVYLITVTVEIPVQAFVLQQAEVAAVRSAHSVRMLHASACSIGLQVLLVTPCVCFHAATPTCGIRNTAASLSTSAEPVKRET